MRTVFAMIALFALVSASIPTLAESLLSADLLSCCNTALCPLHAHKMRTVQKDMTDCARNQLPGADSSMIACDTTSIQAVGITAFVLRAPLAIVRVAMVQNAPSSVSRFVPFKVSVPTTPPPRTLPS
jgi:hypothetical protein